MTTEKNIFYTENPVVVFSNNSGKLKEIASILGNAIAYTYLTNGVPITVEETGNSFEENAILKVKALSFLQHHIGLADDSGLEVDALQKKPGIYSARYGGEHLSDKQRCHVILNEMRGIENRSAAFVCVIAILFPNRHIQTVKGTILGKIAHHDLGENGFGYDPIFIPDGFDLTMAQLSSDIKNSISHRHQALHKVHLILNPNR
jgi:XTP/dITP diphosphohydrolase